MKRVQHEESSHEESAARKYLNMNATQKEWNSKKAGKVKHEKGAIR